MMKNKKKKEGQFFSLPNVYLIAIHNDGGKRKRLGKSF
jgi:hypothetical protein